MLLEGCHKRKINVFRCTKVTVQLESIAADQNGVNAESAEDVCSGLGSHLHSVGRGRTGVRHDDRIDVEALAWMAVAGW